MEENDFQAALAAAVEEVLETMCFATVFASSEGAAPQAQTGDGPVIAAELGFQGTPAGRFHVSITHGVARQLAAGFLGLDETGVSDSQATEVVCELANMICGQILSRQESETIFHLLQPELVQPGAGPVSNGAGHSRWFDLGSGVLTATLGSVTN